MEKILNEYYEDNAKKLRGKVDRILKNFGGLSDKDYDDFYSLANEVFVDVMKRYDGVQAFDGLLYVSLENKIKTEITRRNRQKRQSDRNSISWETPMNDENDITIGDFITDTKKAEHYDIDKTFFEDDGEKYSEKMLLYITKLSKLQKEVVKLIVSGYTKEEIKQKLHITNKEYKDCIESMSSYKNISILF